jgi:hypothetical protein
MKFKISKAYEHSSGLQYYICGEINTLMFGKCLLAENRYNKYKNNKSKRYLEFSPVGSDNDSTANFFEIPVELFKLHNFDLHNKEIKYCLRRLKLNRILKK